LGFLKVLSRGAPRFTCNFVWPGFVCLVIDVKNINIHRFIFFQSPNKIYEKVRKESGRGFRKMDILKMSNFEKGPIIFFGKIVIFGFAVVCSKMRFFGKMLFA
jgi:hypothetical protein